MKADLHIHSTSSDGYDTIDVLLQQYSDKKKNYTHIAITDHDTVAPLLRNDMLLEKKRQKYNIDIIQGMEYGIDINGQYVHLLCYFDKFSDVTKPILEYIENRKKLIKLFNKEMKNKLWQQGILVPDLEYEKLDDTGYMPFIQEVVKYSSMSPKECFGMFLKYLEKIEQSNRIKLDARDIIKEVHKSKGLVVMAHPLKYKKETIDMAIKLGIDGLECIYGKYDDEQRNHLIDIANQHKLLITAGSDYHSKTDYVKHGQIGDVALTGEYLENFIKRLRK